MAPLHFAAGSGTKAENGVPDMTILSNIDEHGINTNLSARYHRDQIYTYTGTILVAVNPYKELPIYETEWVFRYNGQGQKMSQQEPHVFAIAEAAYSSLQSENRNQACVISGESGAGKTESTKFILQYLCTVTSNQSTWMEHQILEANTILEAFGNAKTVRNDNSSRFGKFIQVCFNARYEIKGCVIQDYLLEQSRITFQSPGERNYHIFYQLVAAGQTSLEFRNQFLIDKAETYAYLKQSGCYRLDGVDDSAAFDNLRLAMSVLNMPQEMCDGIFAVLSAILWLGNIQFEECQDGERCKLMSDDEEVLATVAALLGLDAVRLTQAALQRQINVRGNITEIPFKEREAKENRHAMAKALYSRTFAWIVNFINTCTSPGHDAARFLGVLDIFGFENFTINSFEQLCINYANEKLHRFFNHYVFALEQEMYRQEGINFAHINFTDNTPCLELLEKPPKCIFRLLTEECRVPKGTDTTYVNKLHSEFEGHVAYAKGDDRRRWEIEFGIKHYAGDVVYKAVGFLDKNKDAQQDQLFDLMSGSSNIFVKDLVRFQDLLGVTASRNQLATNNNNCTSQPAGPRASGIYGTYGGSTTSIASSTSSNTSTLSATSKGRPTVGDAFRVQLTALVDILHSTNPWYVRCIKPNTQKAPNCYDNKQVLSQLRYLGMLDIIRIRREGYPIHYELPQFIARYKCLTRGLLRFTPGQTAGDCCSKMLAALHMPKNDWQIGKNRVFMRASVHEPLEEHRAHLLYRSAATIQKRWRGLVCRREYLLVRRSAIKIQQHFRGHRQRLNYLRRKRAAITIQAFVRGMFAREVASAMRQMKRVEEEMRRKEREEAEKRLLDDQRRRRDDQDKAEKELMEKTGHVEPGLQVRCQEGLASLTSLPQSDDGKCAPIDDSVLKLLEQRYGLAQEEVQNITRMMEQSGFLQRKSRAISGNFCASQASSNSYDRFSTGTGSSGGSENYVDLDKMFAFLSELQQDGGQKGTNGERTSISDEFNRLIQNTESQLDELDDIKPKEDPLPPPPPAMLNINENRNLPLPPPPTSAPTGKPTQEVAPIVVNGTQVDNMRRLQPRDSPIYAALPAIHTHHHSTSERSYSFEYSDANIRTQMHNMANNANAPETIMENDADSRRKQRVERKLQQMQDSNQNGSPNSQPRGPSGEPANDGSNRTFEMLEYAEKHFNSHVRDFGSGSSVMRTLTLTRKKRSEENELVSKAEMLTFSPLNIIPTSHIHMHDPENAILACQMFKELTKYLAGDLKPEAEIKLIQSIISKALEREELRDEIFVQLCRQSTNNPSRDETVRAWVLFGLASAAFQPSKLFSKYLQNFLRKYLRKDAAISCYAQFCLDNLSPKGSIQSARKMPPSSLEINAVKTLSSLVCRFYFLDGRTKAIDVHPSDTASDAMSCLANKIGLRNLDGWALYELTPDYEKVIKGHDYLADIISQWEAIQKNSIYGTKYGTIGKNGPNIPSSECKFVFKKRLFRNTREIPHDPVEVNLLFSQAVHSVVKRDEFPVSERIALQLGGLQAQVSLGEFVEGRTIDKYEDVENYLCSRVRKGGNSQRTNMDWAVKIAEAHRMYGSGKTDLIAKVWYLSVVMQYPLYGTTLFPVQYTGYLSYGANLQLGINAEGVLIISSSDKSILNAYRYGDIESVQVYPGPENFITIKLNKALAEQHKIFTFETKQKNEIAALVASYSPNLSNWMRKGGNQAAPITSNEKGPNPAGGQAPPTSAPGRRLLKMSLEDRMKFHQELVNTRKTLIDSGRLRKATEAESVGFMKSTLRRFNKNKSDKTKIDYAAEFDSEIFRSFPHSFWAYSKSGLQNSIMVISDPEQEGESINNFNAILAYSGLAFAGETNGSNNGPDAPNEESEWSRPGERDPVRLAQKIIERCCRKEASDIFRNEFFLQLIKQTTDHPDPNSKVNIRHWQLLALACSVSYPTDRRILAYLHAHLRKCSLDEVTQEGEIAQFTLKNLQGSLETRGRKMPPSRPEIISTIAGRRIYARIHFLDGQFQAVEFDACATISEVIEQIQIKIGLRARCPGYALYQQLGSTCEQALQLEEKVGDALSYWEKWHEEQSKGLMPRKAQHFFVFKKHILLDAYIDLKDQVEKELLLHQIIFSIRNDKFPISEQEAVMLCALKAQIDLGDFDQNGSPSTDYRQHMASCLPPRLVQVISPEAVVTQHQTMRGIDAESAKQSFFNLIQSWPLHRSTIFEVTQTYTSSWPKNLWLAVDQTGLHLLELKTRNVLTSCDYRNMVDYSPTQNSLMIVAMGNNSQTAKTVKYIFLTPHALQIAQLIRDYTTVLARERGGVGRRKSVEFDLSAKSGPKQPPVPPPRPSLAQRQQHMIMTGDQQMLLQSNHFMPGAHPGMMSGQMPMMAVGGPMHFAHPGNQVNFQPTHRRSRPLSVLYKPPPAVLNEPDQV